ncbi:PAS domain S-box protein [Verrucomicrobiota bacterium sgz303538]
MNKDEAGDFPAFQEREAHHSVEAGEFTARRHPQDDPLATPERIRAVLDSMFAFVAVISLDGRLLEVNRAPLEAAGLRREEVLGRRFCDTFWFSGIPDAHDQLRRLLQQAAAGETLREDITVRFEGGYTQVIDATFSPLRDERGYITEVIASGVNVTGRRVAEESLRQLARQNEMILNTAGEGICGIDTEGRATFINQAAARMFGYEVQELLGQPIHLLVHHTHADGTHFPSEECPILRVLMDGKQCRCARDVFWRKNGTSLTVEYVSDPMYDGETVIGAVVVFNDITSRIEAEEARQESELRFRQVVESIRELFWISDLEKNQLYLSPGFEQTWGVPYEELMSSPTAWMDVIHPEDRSRIEAAIAKQVRGEYDEEFRVVWPDGTIRWIRDRAFPVKDEGGTVYRLTGLAEDITESKRLDEQLRQSQKMEAIGQLAAGVAHDFNNLLAVIQGNASLLCAELEDASAAAEYARDIIQASERAAGLTRQLLLFSSKQAMHQTNLELNEVVTEITRMLQRILGEDIALTADYAPKLPMIFADRGMIEQILLNLAVNARDAMPDGGRLIISTSTKHVGAEDAQQNSGLIEGPYVCLSVSDNGVGIPHDVLPRIFEPFFTTKEVGKGTGLGLPTVYGIVKQHRGCIEVHSQPGEGTTFQIRLPAIESAATDAKQSSTKRPLPTGTETILVVEDEAALRLITCQLLQRCGYTVLSAVDGVSAQEIWKEHGPRIDLLLTDMVMPGGVTGQALAQRLQAEKPHLKVIFTSGYNANIIGKDPILTEGVTYLQKPYQAPRLAETIRKCLGRS